MIKPQNVAKSKILVYIDAGTFDGTSRVMRAIAPRSAAAAEIRTTDLLTAAPVTLYAHYHGGCRFDFDDVTSPAAQVLAVYTGMAGAPPAIVSSGVGRGSAILTGVHLEMSERECKDALYGHSDMAAHLHVCQKLAETEKARSEVFRQLLHRAGLTLR